MKKLILSIAASLFTYSLATAQTNLIAYYPLDGDVQDYSGNDNHGIIEGDTVFANNSNYQANKALSFDGIDDWVRLTNFAVPDTFAVSLWTYTEQEPTTNGAFISKGRTAPFSGVQPENVFLLGSYGEDNVLVNIDGTSTGTLAVVDEVNWHHIVTNLYKINSNSTKVEIYYDDTLIVTTTVSNAIAENTGTNPWVLGMELDGQGNLLNDQSDFFKGRLDEIRIYDNALTSNEVSSLYGLDIIAYYPLDGDVKDYSGNGNHGTIEGDEIYEENVKNEAGASLAFDGVDDWVRLTNFEVPDTFAISLWTYTDQEPIANGAFISKGRPAPFSGVQPENVFLLGSYGENNVLVNVDGTSTGTLAVVDEVNWHHIVTNLYKINSTSTKVEIYYDNVLIVTTTVSNAIAENTGTNPWVLGMELDGQGNLLNDQSDFFQGRLDEIKIFGKSLNSNDVNNLYTASIITGNSNISEISNAVYPNPSNGVIHISSNDIININLFNLSGQLLTTSTQSHIEYDVPGVYLLEINTTTHKETVKVLIK